MPVDMTLATVVCGSEGGNLRYFPPLAQGMTGREPRCIHVVKSVVSAALHESGKQGVLYLRMGRKWPLHHELHWNQGDPTGACQ